MASHCRHHGHRGSQTVDMPLFATKTRKCAIGWLWPLYVHIFYALLNDLEEFFFAWALFSWLLFVGRYFVRAHFKNRHLDISVF